MRDLLPPLRTFLAANGLLRPDALLLVAVSGGPDSLSLLHLLHRLRADGGPQLHVAHLDHGLRPEAAAEAEAVRATAEAWDIPATVERREVAALGAGPMDAARRVRYAFLAETAHATGADAVTVAHHADDQAETVLMHLLRGAGPAGLRGMRPVVPWGEWAGQMQNAKDPMQNGPLSSAVAGNAPDFAFCILHFALLLRPLLSARRLELEAYCHTHGLAPADDPSNRSPRYARTAVRRLLGSLAAEHPNLVEALGRTAQISADDYAFIQAQLASAWPALAVEQPGSVQLRRGAWEALHPALQRYALRRAATLLGAPALSLPLVEAARTLAAQPGRHMRLGPQLQLEVEQAGLRIARTDAPAHADAPQLPLAELPLAVPGLTPLCAGWACVVSDAPPATPSRWWVALSVAALDGPLSLRRRLPGDRFRPAGGRGSRSLQDFLVDRKLPQRLRAAWPILATPAAVVWVAGLRADARFIAAPQSQGTIWVGLVQVS